MRRRIRNNRVRLHETAQRRVVGVSPQAFFPLLRSEG